jgi:competence protein ComEC
MVEFFRKAPFFRFLFFLLAGILIRFWIPVNGTIILMLLLITFFSWIGLLILNRKTKSIHFYSYFGLLLYLFLILQGIYTADYKINTINSQYFPENKKILVACLLSDFPDERAKSYKCFVTAKQYQYNDSTFPSNNRFILYLEKSRDAANLKPGDVLIARIKPQKIATFPGNNGFDYAKYMFKQGIIYSAYSSGNNWIKADSGKITFIEKVGFTCKTSLLNLLKKAGLKGNDFAVASALTIGYRADLDKEIRQAYSTTGTTHILAVSGMHVGLLYFVLGFFLGFLDKFKPGKIMKPVLLIGIVWFYAFLSGLCPSILRSALMITFIGFGQTLGRQSFIFNSIAGSAFLLLLFDPLQVADVGFQLSYSAVIGIVIFYPYIYKWFQFKNVFLDQVWQLTSVSIAAQLLTFPLTVYYFKQFPILFILSNILAIPISTIAMYAALLLVCVSFIPFTIQIIGFVLKVMVNLLNLTVLWIEHIPYSYVSGLSFSATEVVLWYFLIVNFSLFLIMRKGLFLMMVLLSILILQWINIFNLLSG